jgi:hypothetical protein
MNSSDDITTNQCKLYVQQIIATYGLPNAPDSPSIVRIWKGFLAHATPFNQVDWEASRRLAKRYRTKQKQCFNNCRQIHLNDQAYRYFEGYACPMIPMEHAWLLRADGVVLDPTLALLDEPGDVDYFGLHVQLKDMLDGNMWEPHWLKPLLQILETEIV